MVICLNYWKIYLQLSLNKCETALKLKEIDLYSSANHLVAKETDIGFVALTHKSWGKETKFQKPVF